MTIIVNSNQTALIVANPSTSLIIAAGIQGQNGANGNGSIAFVEANGFTGNVTNGNLTIDLQIANATQAGELTAAAFNAFTGAVSNVTVLQGNVTNLTTGLNTTNSTLNSTIANVTTLQGNVSSLFNITASTDGNVTNLTSSKQNTLVSGTNIKTINGNSVLGAGDLIITGGGNITGIAGFTDANGFTGTVTNNSLSLVLQHANATQDGQVTATNFNDWQAKGTSNLTVGNTTGTAFDGALGAGTVSNITALQGNVTNVTADYVPKSTTINGVNLSSNITLTTANISDSTNKRYVTDSQLVNVTNLTGTNTGDQTITLSGDVSGTGTTNITATLATVNSNTGIFGNATIVPSITVNGKGLITAVSNNTIPTSNTTVNGLLTATDWNTFNSKGTSNLTIGTTTGTAFDGALGSGASSNITTLQGNVTNLTTAVNALNSAMMYVGDWDASTGVFPGGGTAQKGYVYTVSVAGTVDGIAFDITDRIDATADNASTTTYAGNWFKEDYTDRVTAVNGQVGSVNLTTANISASTNKNYVTDTQLAVLNVTSGTNTGDQNLSGYVQSTRTINGQDLTANVNLTATNITMAALAGSTYYTVQAMQDQFHSTGWINGGVVSDAGGGLISVTAGQGFIRATNSDIAQIVFCDWPASSPANVVLPDGAINYIYVEYNSGSPRVIATTTERTDKNTNIYLAKAYRNGTAVHINDKVKFAVSDHAGKMIQQMQDVMPYDCATGNEIGATGTRNFSISSGKLWNGLISWNSAAFDSSGSGTFTYIRKNGSGGYTETTAQTQINNTQYDNGTGTLATLSNNQYGVHWVYRETDDDVVVMYGEDSYTLVQAQDAQPPAALPNRLVVQGYLVGKIIIQKSASSFAQIQNACVTAFTGAQPTEHSGLANLGWTVSGHTGSNSVIAGFNATGVTSEYSLNGNGTQVLTNNSAALGTPVSGNLTNCTGNATGLTAGNVSGVVAVANGGTGLTSTKALVQSSYTSTGTMATGTTTIPLDNTTPQSSEGDQYMTLSHTPLSSSNRLEIEVGFTGTHSSAATSVLVALFKDSDASALKSNFATPANVGYVINIHVYHEMTAGTTSAITFKVRAGGNASGTTTFNGSNSTAYLNGTIASYISIKEYAP